MSGESQASGGHTAPTLVGSWRLLGEVAHGGGGVVHRAEHVDSRQPAAVKILHAVLSTLPAARERFAREIDVLRRLQHPNIVRLLDHGQLSDGRPFVVVEWIDGGNLAERLATGRLGVGEALEVLDGVGAAVTAAHDAGLLHRDLKASNVVLRRRTGAPLEAADVLLVDFGIALDAAEARLTFTGASVGTPASMAPEQLIGGDLDARTDVYALGALGFQLLSGHPPFPPLSAGTLDLGSVRDREILPRLPPELGVAPALENELLACLAFAPDARPASVTEALARFRRAVAPEASTSAVTARACRAVAVLVDSPGSSMTILVARCNAEGLQVIHASAEILIAARLLADCGDDALVELARARTQAQTWGAEIEGLGITRVQAGEVMTLCVQGRTQIVGGPLLATSSWPEDSIVPPHRRQA